MFQIQCDCGKINDVRSSQAGATLRCQCGESLRIPSLSVLRDFAQRHQPAPAESLTAHPSAREGSAAGIAAQGHRPESDEDGYRILFGEVGRQGTISQSAMMHFVAAVDQRLSQVLAAAPADEHGYLQVSIAIYPGHQMLVECVSYPRSAALELCEKCEAAIAGLEVPPIQDSPIALRTVKIVGAPDPLTDVPLQPFERERGVVQQRGLGTALALIGRRLGVPETSLPPVQPLPAWHTRWWASVRMWLRTHLPLERLPWRRLPWQRNVPSDSKSPQQAYFEARDFFFSYLQDARRASPDLIRQTAIARPDEGLVMAALADLYAREGKLDNAIHCYSAAIHRLPGFSLLLALRGKLYEAAGNTQKALRDYSRAIDQQPFDPWFFQQRAEIFAELEAFEQVEHDLSQAHALDPEDPDILVARSVALTQQNELRRAVVDLEQAVVLDPYNPAAHKLLGRLLQVAEPADHIRAIEMYSRVLEVSPEDEECLLRRASTYEMQQKFELALEDCGTILKRDPENAQAYALRGNIYQKQSEYEAAINDCSQAIEHGFEAAFVFIARGISYASLGDLDLARNDCEAALLLEPENPVALYFKGRLALSEGEIDAAMEAFDQACELEPDWMEPRAHRAFVHRIQSNPRAAVDEQTELIEHDPHNEANWVNRAFAYAELSEYELAEADFNRAIELAEENEELYYLRGMHFLERRQFDFALRDFNQALRLDPQHENSLLRRAQVFLQLRQAQAAYDDLSRLIARNGEDGQLYVARMQSLIDLGHDEQAQQDLQTALEKLPEEADAIHSQHAFAQLHRDLREGRYEAVIEGASEWIDDDEESRWAYSLRSAAYWYSESLVEADEDLTALIEMEADVSSAYCSRGQVRAELGEYNAALEDLDEALRQGSEQGDVLLRAYALNGRALALAGLGRLDESQEAFEESIVLAPENAWAQYNRGLVLYHHGDRDRAATHFGKALELDRPELPQRKRSRIEHTLRQLESEPGTDASSDSGA